MKTLTIRGMMALVAALALLCAVISYQGRMIRMHLEASRRAQCVYNLKAIAIAIAEYAEPPAPGSRSYGVYPPGTVFSPTISPGKRCGWASLIYLLDHEGCSGCPVISGRGRSWDRRSDPGRAGHMYCPSCPRPSAAKSLVPAAYIGIAGLGVDAPSLPTSDKRAGIFGDDRVVAPSDITDGFAQTMMVAESSASAGPWFAGGRNTVRGLDPRRQPYIGMGRQFGGMHGDWANVLMADGSIRRVKDTVDPKVFEAMSTIAGGEKVSVP